MTFLVQPIRRMRSIIGLINAFTIVRVERRCYFLRLLLTEPSSATALKRAILSALLILCLFLHGDCYNDYSGICL